MKCAREMKKTVCKFFLESKRKFIVFFKNSFTNNYLKKDTFKSMESPKLQDRLFIESTGLNYDYASINRRKGTRNELALFYLIEGYREASFVLIEELLNNHNQDWLKIDSFIYPVIFNFRHYLEIIIKDTLRYYRLINNEVLNDQIGFKNTHSLKTLWSELKPYLEQTYSAEVNLKDDLLAVEQLIDEIEEKDKGSFSFRYPYEGSKKIETPVQFTLPSMTIEIENLKLVMKKLSNFFEGINHHAAVILDQ